MNFQLLTIKLQNLINRKKETSAEKPKSLFVPPTQEQKSAKSITGTRARLIMEDLRTKIFAEALYTFVIRDRLRYLAARDRTYFESREIDEKNVRELVEYMCTINLDVPAMREVVRLQPTNMQSFLLDRFIYADEFLSKYPNQEFFVKTMGDFLRWGLIDIWNSRVRVGEWM